MPSEIFVTVSLQRRPLWKRILFSPKIFFEDYKILRKYNSVFVSLYGAWLFSAKYVVSVK